MGVERKTRSKKSKTKTNKWVENENGLYIANMGKNWTSADVSATNTLHQPQAPMGDYADETRSRPHTFGMPEGPWGSRTSRSRSIYCVRRCRCVLSITT